MEALRKKIEFKKKMILLLLFVNVLLISGISISAYYYDKAMNQNSFTVGYNEIQVIEEFTPPSELRPGVAFTKSPAIKNTGTVPCYVRMFAEANNSSVGKYMSYDFNTTEWSEKKADGFYYYNTILQPGETTEALFTTVTIASDAVESELKDFDIIVYSESVQSDGYDTAEDAWNAMLK